jgi:S1-C subfamily serine protease
MAREVVKRIILSAVDGKKGRVDRADLGIDLKPLQDLETFYDIDINKGVLVNSVTRGSPAAVAGVRTQDILLDINAEPINVRFPEEIAPARNKIAGLPIGKPVNLTLKRGKETIHVTCIAQKLEGAVGEEKAFKAWGLSVRDVTRAYANEHQLDDDTGVVVTSLSSGFPAAKAELQDGDVIRSVNRQPATDLDEFLRLYNAAIEEKSDKVLLEVQRGRARQAAVLKIEYSSVTTKP